jgi:hypothetical protein
LLEKRIATLENGRVRIWDLRPSAPPSKVAPPLNYVPAPQATEPEEKNDGLPAARFFLIDDKPAPANGNPARQPFFSCPQSCGRPTPVPCLQRRWTADSRRPFPGLRSTPDTRLKTPDGFPANPKAGPPSRPNQSYILPLKASAGPPLTPPTLGGVNSKKALWTRWLGGTRGMVGIEYQETVAGLTNGAYFCSPPSKSTIATVDPAGRSCSCGSLRSGLPSGLRGPRLDYAASGLK